MITAATSSWTDLRDAVAAGTNRAILPFGALEQHGPHLPLQTDTMIASEVSRRVAAEVSAVLLPAVPFGATWNNAGYPGTVSLRPETVTAIAVDICTELGTWGITEVVIVNGDWGNRAPLRVAAEMLAGSDVQVLILDYPGFEEEAAVVRESAPAAEGLAHAEELETSLILAIDADSVRQDRYEACYPDFPADFGHRPMQLHPFSESGVFGDPRTASSAKGDRLLEAIVAASTAMITATG